MAHFAIGYDLHNQRTYPPVWNLLKSWGAVRLLESFWLATLNSTAAQVRDALQRVVDTDDSVAVIELKTGSDWACVRAKPEGVEWLRRNLRA
jgi:flagellar biosynthesis/type III secretory pathway ATPase